MKPEALAKTVCTDIYGEVSCRCAEEKRPWPGAWCARTVDKVQRVIEILGLVEERRNEITET